MNVLILTSSSRNFPIDIHQEITKAGQNAIRFSQLADFFSSPLRHRPYLAILEIGNPEDIQRGILAYEWAQGEEFPCRFLLLLSSKYLQLGEKALRFAGSETAVLPMATKNLLFKIELQLKLLVSDKPKPASNSLVFRADVQAFERHRVLKLKGPNPFEGKWNRDLQNSPSGKIRWRWVRTHAAENSEQEKAIPSWTLESDTIPVYLAEEKVWQVTDNSANLFGHYGEEEIFCWKTFLEKRGLFLDSDESKESHKSEAEKKSRPQKEKLSAPTEINSPINEKKNSNEESSEAQARKDKGASLDEKKSKDRTKRPNLDGSTLDETSEPPGKDALESETNSKKKSLHQEAFDDEKKGSRSKETQEVLEEEKKKKKGNAGSSLLSEEVSSPGEDQRDRNWSNQQEQALPGPAESHQKRAKIVLEDLANPIKDKRKMETLNTEQHSPSQKEITEEEIISKKRRKEFEIQEKQTRSNLNDRVEIEGTTKLKNKIEIVGEESPESPEKSENLVPEENPSLEEIFSRPPKKTADDTKDGKNEPIQEKEEKQINKSPTNEESFQSAAKSYGYEKEISKKIVANPQDLNDKGGKIDIEIPADRQLLEHEKRIAPFPERLELEKTFSPDKPEKALDSEFLKVRHFEILSLKDLDDENSSWHPVDQFRVYLKAKHRYYGIKDVREIFPLWIYSGELAPEFLEKEQSWKFYDRPPKKFLLQDPLPVGVARFVQKLAQISGNENLQTSRAASSLEGLKQEEGQPQEVFPQNEGSNTESPTAETKTTRKDGKKNSKKGVIGFLQKLFGKKP